MGRISAVAGEELVDQEVHDRGLRGRGVLRLVDQHVLDPPVQLEEHPQRTAGRAQEGERALDQVLVVETGATRLERLVGVECRRTDAQQRLRTCGDAHGPEALAGLHQTEPFAPQRAPVAFIDGLGRQLLARGGSVLLQKAAAMLVEQPGAIGGRGGEPAQNRSTTRLIGLFAAIEQRVGGRDERLGIVLPFPAGAFDQALGRIVGGEVQRLADRGDHRFELRLARARVAGEGGTDPAAGFQDLTDGLGEARFGQEEDELGKGPTERPVGCLGGLPQHALPRLDQELGGGTLVDRLEVWRHVRFERETAEQARGERVDGHDRQALRQIEHGGEEAARPLRL